MKKQRSPAEMAAMAAARRRSYLFIVGGLLGGTLMLALTGELVALQCVVLAAITLASALSCAWAAVALLRECARRAGLLGGMAAALAYVAPFVAASFYRFASMDDATAARLAGQMSAAETTRLLQQSFALGAEYFRGQYISYVFGYLLFGLMFGMLLGSLGGILAQRTGN